MSTLLSLLHEALLERDCTENHARQLRQAIRKYGEHLGKSAATVEDLHPLKLNEWIASLQESGHYKSSTVKSFAAAIKFVWRYSFETGVVETEPKRIRKIKVRRDPPRAWTADEMRILVSTASTTLRGCVPETPIKKRLWFVAYILSAYSTALRYGDLTQVHRADIRDDGLCSLKQSKTGDPVLVRFSHEARLAIARLPDYNGLALPWPDSRQRFYQSFQGIVRRAGIRRGTPKWLRRSGATAAETLEHGAGTRLLGHRCPDMARKHYLDASLCGVPPEVPALYPEQSPPREDPNPPKPVVEMALDWYAAAHYEPEAMAGRPPLMKERLSNAISRLYKFAGKSLTVAEVTPELLDAFVNWGIAQGHVPSTYTRHRHMVWQMVLHAQARPRGEQ